jgi:pimeloyl-ACP methyl ester carboxylesterase
VTSGQYRQRCDALRRTRALEGWVSTRPALLWLDRAGPTRPFSRPIIFDRRGTGASDGVPYDRTPTWEEWAEDLGAVLEAVESAEAVLVGALDARPFAILYAALHPERVRALVLSTTAARYLIAQDYPIGVAAQDIDAFIGLVAGSWGTPEFAGLVDPLVADQGLARLIALNNRASATPRAAAAQYGYLLRSLDVRQALPPIRVPTLVLHRRDSPFVPLRLGQYLAREIAGAAFVEVPGGSPDGPSAAALDAIEQFVTGERPRVAIESVLTTVLFTDIVGSTEMAASLGDRRWHTLLDFARPDRSRTAPPLPWAGDQYQRRRFHGQLRWPGPGHPLRQLDRRSDALGRRQRPNWCPHR